MVTLYGTWKSQQPVILYYSRSVPRSIIRSTYDQAEGLDLGLRGITHSVSKVAIREP